MFSLFVIAVGLLFVISPLARGAGFTIGAVVGVVLVAAGSFRLSTELRTPR